MIAMCIVIAKACDGFEVAADYLGRNLSDGVKGATINAIASSMPELLTTVFFLAFANTDTLGYNLAASIGGDAGSAIFNSIIIPIFVILTVIKMGVAAGANVSKKVILRDGLFLIAAEILLLILLSSDVLTPMHGWIFVGFYLVYLSYTLLSMKKSDSDPEQEEDEDDDEEQDMYEKFIATGNRSGKAWFLLTVVTLVIAGACAGLVHATEMLAGALQINMIYVALILVAAASSVPDTIISMRDAKKGNHNDALSNVLGSNIFDITISMGLPLALYLWFTGQTIDFSKAGPTLIDLRIVLLAVTVLTIGVFYFSKQLGKLQVVLLILLYGAFIAYCAEGAYPETMLGEVVNTFSEWLNTNVQPVVKGINSALGF